MQNPFSSKTSIDPGQKVAVVGSGISGLVTAWLLSQKHQVVLFEKNAKLGGHTNTVQVNLDGQSQSVDTGFIVFNRPNYPNLTAMFHYLKVQTEPTDMSFSVSVNQGELEYSGNNLNTLFAQRRNLISMAHWKMLREILRFNRIAKADLQRNESEPDFVPGQYSGDLAKSLGEYLSLHGFGKRMQNYYLLPMAAAIWSCPVETMMSFPAGSFLRFFENHGLLNVEDRPQWETVTGGSQTYIDAILELADFEYRLNSPVKKVVKQQRQLKLSFEGGEEVFDHVVFASHGDQSYQMLSNSLQNTFDCLQHFTYQQNIAYLHRDLSLMPKRKLAWASWNYLRSTDQQENAVAVTYWINLLQNLDVATPILVTLNPLKPPAEEKTWQRIVYEHPVFDSAAMQAQLGLKSLQGKENLWFCGAYNGYGFHEDGLQSAVDIARAWQIDLPWESLEVSSETSRIAGCAQGNNHLSLKAKVLADNGLQESGGAL